MGLQMIWQFVAVTEYSHQLRYTLPLERPDQSDREKTTRAKLQGIKRPPR